MSPTIKDQLSTTAKSHVETQLSIWHALNLNVVDGITKLVNLNLRVMKGAVEETSAKAHALMASKNSLDFFSLAGTEDNLRRLVSYSKDAANITASMQEEFFKATQIVLAGMNEEWKIVFENVTEHEVDRFKNMAQLTQHAVEVVHDNNEPAKRGTKTEQDKPAKKATQHVSTYQVPENKKGKGTSSASRKTNTHH